MFDLIRQHWASREVAGSIPDEFIGFSIDLILPAALWSIQSLTEMSTRNLLWGKGRPALKSDNLIAICEPIV
jgi:hypothetical protein